MRRFLRPVAIFSTTAYLLAVMCGVALHSVVHVHIGHAHAHTHTHAHAGGHHDHDHPHGETGCCHHHHGDAEQRTPEHAPCDHHDHDHDHQCVVCDFLAQVPVPVAPVEIPPDLDVIEPVVLIAATTPAPRPFSAWQGRAPPV